MFLKINGFENTIESFWSDNMSQYVSCIKINGRPILPPLMTDAKRREANVYKDLAIDVDKRLKNRFRRCSVSSDSVKAARNKSTPARPVTLNLQRRRNTLENRLAQDSESETESERKRWSPLQVDALSELRLQTANDSDSAQDTPDTVTASPKLLRQGSYTIIEPRILSNDDLSQLADFRSNSGRKTWDLRQAKEQWSSINPVPSIYPVPCDLSEPTASVPSVREQLSCLSEVMITMKLKHEHQRRELEIKQAAEEKEYEKMFTFKQRQILQFVGSSRELASLPDNFRVEEPRIPHSELDTDIDVSFVEDSCRLKAEDSETWSCSSVMSNEPVKEPPRFVQSFREYSSPERDRRNRAASKISAAARGYLTRRLMRTENVRALRRSLMDSIHVCRSLQSAPDLGSSDVKFMDSLKRQIFSDWDALYGIFMRKPLAEQLELIAMDRERIRAQKKLPDSAGRRMSAATVKSIQRKQKVMSSSLTLPRSPSFKRSCFKMSTSLSGALPPRCK